jgi:hypothetical protein
MRADGTQPVRDVTARIGRQPGGDEVLAEAVVGEGGAGALALDAGPAGPQQRPVDGRAGDPGGDDDAVVRQQLHSPVLQIGLAAGEGGIAGQAHQLGGGETGHAG